VTEHCSAHKDPSFTEKHTLFLGVSSLACALFLLESDMVVGFSGGGEKLVEGRRSGDNGGVKLSGGAGEIFGLVTSVWR
jgi:hypothetical protein